MIKLPPKLKEDIEAYCKLNEVEDSTDFAIKCTKDGLTLDKYGVAPFLPKSQIQEVPVEKVVYETVIKPEPFEVPVYVQVPVPTDARDFPEMADLKDTNVTSIMSSGGVQ